jgi:hypothetical protein
MGWMVESSRTRSGNRADWAWGGWVSLTLTGMAAFWSANLLISLTPIAAAYRSALSIEYVPMVLEAAVGGLIIAGVVALIMVRSGTRVPGGGPLRRALFLAMCVLVAVTLLVEVPAKLGAGIDDPGSWLIAATIFNTIRVVVLGLAIGLVARRQAARAELQDPRVIKE